jgi:hypothetical protein
MGDWRVPRPKRDAANASLFELLHWLAGGTGQAGQRCGGELAEEEDDSLFLFFVFIRILIRLTCRAIVHLSKRTTFFATSAL